MNDRTGELADMPEAAQAILVAAREIIDQHGENGLRVTDVAERAGVAVGLLYHYFKDRVALIAAVREAQFLARIEADIAAISQLVKPKSTGGVLRTIIDDFSDPHHSLRGEYRQDRIEALVAARHNPELTARLVEAQGRLAREIQATTMRAKADGLLADDVDTKALAFFLEVLPLGTVLATVYGDNLPTNEEWRSLLYRMFRALAPDS